MNLRYSLVIIMSITYSSSFAADQNTEDPPSLEFLEFLGEWENDDGEWIDPNQFEDDTYVRLDDFPARQVERQDEDE